MTAYIIRRLLFMVPTLLGIMLVSFVVVQFAPGGPVERVIAQLSGADTGAILPREDRGPGGPPSGPRPGGFGPRPPAPFGGGPPRPFDPNAPANPPP